MNPCLEVLVHWETIKVIMMELLGESEQFNCDECNKSFMYRKSLNEHVQKLHSHSYFAKELKQNQSKSVEKNIRFRCAVCYKGYIYRRALREHIRLRHADVNSVYNEEGIVEINAGEKRLRCTRCSKCYVSQNGLTEHIHRAHPDMYITTENNYKENIIGSETEDGSYNCDECSKSFSHYNSLFKHVQKFHPIRPVLCVNPASSPSEEEKLVRKHKSYKKYHYKTRLEQRNSLKHKKQTVQSKEKANIIKNEKEKIQCGTCGTQFNYRKSLIRHIQDKHPEEMCVERPVQVHECAVCYKTFQYRFNLNQHFRRVHPGKQIIVEIPSKTNFECNICHENFHYRFNLTRHINKRHSSNKKDEKTYSNCGFCDKRFLYRFNLHFHIRKKHPEVWIPTEYRKKLNYICACCDRKFSRRFDLIKHIRSKHNQTITKSVKMVKRTPSASMTKRNSASHLCPLCSAAYERKSDMLDHYQDIHDKRITTKIIELPDEDAFNDWKYRVEDETKSKYVKYNFYKKQKEAVRVFICHRSGNFQSRSRGVRHIRLAGSEKINGYCPAQMKVIIPNNSEKYFVHFTDVHIGHGQEIQFLKLQEQRLKCTVDEILHEQACHTEYTELSAEDKQLTDAIILTTWLNDHLDSVLYFKGQEETDDNFIFLNSGEEGDFVLVIMSEFQVDMFKQYGTDVVAVHRTDGPNGYNLELSIIMVLDNFRQGIPCCFMLSNRNDQRVYEIMFAKMAEKTGLVRPKVFMSIVTEIYGKAWNSVMLTPERRLYCSWHVIRLWEQNMTTVKNTETRKSLRQFLYSLRMELNPIRFQEMLDNFLKVSVDELKEFQEYFKQNFSENVSLWAYCFRKYAGINTNFVTERFFRMFKETYLKNKSNYSLEEGLDGLDLLMQNLRLEKIMREAKGKLVFKLKHLRERHKECTIITDEQLNSIQWVSKEKEEWHVPSFGDRTDEVYRVEQILPSCDCKLRCHPCKSCLHEYRCTCLDNCIQYNMCTHIHLVCMWKNKQAKNNDLVEEVFVNEIPSFELSDASVDNEDYSLDYVSVTSDVDDVLTG